LGSFFTIFAVYISLRSIQRIYSGPWPMYNFKLMQSCKWEPPSSKMLRSA